MRSARLRHTVVIERPDGEADEYGQKKKGWVEVGKFRAGVDPYESRGANTERYKNDVRFADATVQIVMRYTHVEIDSTMRVIFPATSASLRELAADESVAERSRIYEVLGVVNKQHRDRELIIYARERL